MRNLAASRWRQPLAMCATPAGAPPARHLYRHMRGVTHLLNALTYVATAAQAPAASSSPSPLPRASARLPPLPPPSSFLSSHACSTSRSASLPRGGARGVPADLAQASEAAQGAAACEERAQGRDQDEERPTQRGARRHGEADARHRHSSACSLFCPS